jgi:hypothetical protein
LSNQSNTGKNHANKIAWLGFFAIIALLIWISSFFNNGGDRESSEPTKTTGSYCPILTKYLNEATEALSQAGTTATIADVSSVLLDRGTALATGFDVEMAGSVERYNLIRETGQNLLQIRVALIDGGDITEPANKYATNIEGIRATCE